MTRYTPGAANTVYVTQALKSSAGPVTAGTVNSYVVAVGGANDGKWWKDSDSTWAAVETATAMTHKSDGQWYVSIKSGCWTDGQRYRIYAKESGDLHIPFGYDAESAYFLSTDTSGRVAVGKWLDTAVATPAVAGVPSVDAIAIEGKTLSARTGDNLDVFFHNANAVSTAVVASIDAATTTRAAATALTTAQGTLTKLETMLEADGVNWRFTTASLLRVWAVTTRALTTLTGFKLASDGLDAVATTQPSGVASNFREMVVQTWRRFFKSSTLTATAFKTYKDDGTTATTQAASDDGITQTIGTAT
jgi:hypothetical protein